MLFPEGYIAADRVFLFDNEQIDQIYALGYQDAEQLAFQIRANEMQEKLKGGQAEA